MFGTDDNNQTAPTNSAPPADSGVATDASLPSAPEPDDVVNPISGSDTAPGVQTSSATPSIDPDTGPAPTIKTDKKLLSTLPQPQAAGPSRSGASTLPEPVADDPAPTTTAPATPTNVDDKDLIDVKQKALQDLTPLVGQLDLNPEEKFKTLMMLVQASDNADLVKEAYAAAGQIEDTKARAQALLDVVNEVNYFTHPHNPVSGEPQA